MECRAAVAVSLTANPKQRRARSRRMSGIGMSRGEGGSPFHASCRNRSSTRGRLTRNAPYGTTSNGITKRRAAEALRHSPEWIVNALDCVQQIARHQGISLSDIPPEMRAAINWAITSTVNHYKKLPIPASECQNPLGRRSLDIQCNTINKASPFPPILSKYSSNPASLGTFPAVIASGLHRDTPSVRTSAHQPARTASKAKSPQQHYGTPTRQKSALQQILDRSDYEYTAFPLQTAPNGE